MGLLCPSAVCIGIWEDSIGTYRMSIGICESCLALPIYAAREEEMTPDALINDRWPNAAAFYSERDNRTVLEVADLHRSAHTPVEIWIDSDFATDLTVQRIALLS